MRAGKSHVFADTKLESNVFLCSIILLCDFFFFDSVFQTLLILPL